jgi:hypothetical protein
MFSLEWGRVQSLCPFVAHAEITFSGCASPKRTAAQYLLLRCSASPVVPFKLILPVRRVVARQTFLDVRREDVSL